MLKRLQKPDVSIRLALNDLLSYQLPELNMLVHCYCKVSVSHQDSKGLNASSAHMGSVQLPAAGSRNVC